MDLGQANAFIIPTGKKRGNETGGGEGSIGGGARPRKPNYDRHAPVRPPPPLLLICGHFLERFQRSFEARRRAVKREPLLGQTTEIFGSFSLCSFGSGVCRRTEVVRRMQNITPLAAVNTVMRDGAAALPESVSEHFARMETDARPGPLMHVDWLRFGRRSILGQSKRSRRGIYGLTTVGRTGCVL